MARRASKGDTRGGGGDGRRARGQRATRTRGSAVKVQTSVLGIPSISTKRENGVLPSLARVRCTLAPGVRANTTRKFSSDLPFHGIDLKDVMCLRVITESDPCCPVCLEEVGEAPFTLAGCCQSLFCLPCLIRCFLETGITAMPCPVCSVAVGLADIRPVDPQMGVKPPAVGSLFSVTAVGVHTESQLVVPVADPCCVESSRILASVGGAATTTADIWASTRPSAVMPPHMLDGNLPLATVSPSTPFTRRFSPLVLGSTDMAHQDRLHSAAAAKLRKNLEEAVEDNDRSQATVVLHCLNLLQPSAQELHKTLSRNSLHISRHLSCDVSSLLGSVFASRDAKEARVKREESEWNGDNFGPGLSHPASSKSSSSSSEVYSRGPMSGAEIIAAGMTSSSRHIPVSSGGEVADMTAQQRAAVTARAREREAKWTNPPPAARVTAPVPVGGTASLSVLALHATESLRPPPVSRASLMRISEPTVQDLNKSSAQVKAIQDMLAGMSSDEESGDEVGQGGAVSGGGWGASRNARMEKEKVDALLATSRRKKSKKKSTGAAAASAAASLPVASEPIQPTEPSIAPEEPVVVRETITSEAPSRVVVDFSADSGAVVAPYIHREPHTIIWMGRTTSGYVVLEPVSHSLLCEHVGLSGDVEVAGAKRRAPLVPLVHSRLIENGDGEPILTHYPTPRSKGNKESSGAPDVPAEDSISLPLLDKEIEAPGVDVANPNFWEKNFPVGSHSPISLNPTLKVVGTEHATVSPEIRSYAPYLSFLPTGARVIFAEVEFFDPALSKDPNPSEGAFILRANGSQRFSGVLAQRRRRRDATEKRTDAHSRRAKTKHEASVASAFHESAKSMRQVYKQRTESDANLSRMSLEALDPSMFASVPGDEGTPTPSILDLAFPASGTSETPTMEEIIEADSVAEDTRFRVVWGGEAMEADISGMITGKKNKGGRRGKKGKKRGKKTPLDLGAASSPSAW